MFLCALSCDGVVLKWLLVCLGGRDMKGICTGMMGKHECEKGNSVKYLTRPLFYEIQIIVSNTVVTI